MKGFSYKEGRFFCEEVNLSELVQEMKTPLYVYSYEVLVDNYRRVKQAFDKFSPLICYSLKANSNLALCRALAQEGAGADIVSGGELYRAIQAGFPPEKIVFAGVGKREDEIKYALQENILMLNVESASELRLIARLSQRLSKEARISVRVNPDVTPETHHYDITGNKESKFGLSFKEAERLYEEARGLKGIKPVGIHMHIGSQITDPHPYLEALEKVTKLFDHLKHQGIPLKYLDMGGGFGISYEDGRSALMIEEIAEKIAPLIQRTGARLIIEPGRYIVGSAGILITRVLYKKRTESKTFIIVDAGMNDLIRPSLYEAYHRIKKLKEPDRESFTEVVDVVGPICESGDFFAQGRVLPKIKEGEYLAIMDAGAYGFSMSSSYNSRPRAAEVLVKDKRWWVVRERETREDLIKGERIPAKFLPSPSCSISFTKMQGCGNDFIIVDNRSNLIRERAEFARKVCARKTGIGADGLLLLEESREADFKMRTFNPDGTEAEMCGNGARCAARFAYLKGITGRECSFWTPSGIIASRTEGDKVKIRMKEPADLELNIKLTLDGRVHQGHYVNTGVPHFVLFVSDVKKAPLDDLAPRIRYHQRFQPEGTNVNFVEIKERRTLKVRTYERGVEGETLGCGTGAVASSLVASFIFGLDSPLKVKMKGGELTVYFRKDRGRFTDVFLEGEAEVVYEGTIPSPLRV